MARDYENMIEQQWQNSLRAAQEGPWAGWDPEVVDYYRSNSPAGFGAWGSNMAPGTVLTPQQVQEVIFNLSQPGHFEGINGMTLEQYLADPRAHFYQNDDGQFIYSPHRERTALKGGDFISKDRETFMETWGPILQLGAMLSGPLMQTAGLIGGGAAAGAGAATSALPAELSNFTLGGAGTGIGGVGSANIGLNAAGLGLTPELVAAGGGASALGASGGLGLNLGTSGLIADTAAALGLPEVRSFTQTITAPSVSSPLTVPSTIQPTVPESTDFSLAQPGQGYGGIGTAGQGLSAGSGGIIGQTAADLAAQAGVTLNPIATGTGAGLGLQLGGGGAIGQTAADLAAQAGVSLPTSTGIGSGIGSGVSVPPASTATSTVPAGAGTAASSVAKLIKDATGYDIDPGLIDVAGKVIGTGLGMYGASQQADATKAIADQYFGMGAPYRSELQNLNANPSSFYQSPIFQGALQQGSDALSRSLSAKVGNPILNPGALQNMQDYTTKGSLDAYNTRWNQLASAGQLGVSQSAPLALNAANAGGNVYNAAGYGLGQLTNNSPNYGDEFMRKLMSRFAGNGGLA